MRVLLAVLLVAATAPAARSQDDRSAKRSEPERIDLLASWLDAVDHHQHGASDESVQRVADWSARDLVRLRAHVQAVVSLIRQPDLSLFYLDEPGRRRSRLVRYSEAELRQLRELANNHGAVADADRCPREPQSAGSGLNGANNLLKRAAMLHLDVAVAIATGLPVAAATPDPSASREFSFMFKVDDGRSVGRINAAGHLQMGRELLELVAEPCSERKAPGRDAWVRDWYAASLAHQVAQQQFEIRHVSRALELFPNDTGILALAGATHEALSTPLMQAGVGDDRALREQLQLRAPSGELDRAEDLLRQALRGDQRQVEARLRLGNVLGLRGKHAEAVGELERAAAEAGEDQVAAYYARMLHGRELDAAGRSLEARSAYEAATRLFPAAHAPRLALSRLLRASGDAAAASEMLERLVDGDSAEDPWWEYYAAAGRFSERMVRALGAITPAAVRP